MRLGLGRLVKAVVILAPNYTWQNVDGVYSFSYKYIFLLKIPWNAQPCRLFLMNPCSITFIMNLFTGGPSNLYDETNPDWAPSQHLGHMKLKTVRSSPRKSSVRYQRTLKRRERATDISTAKILLEMKANIGEVHSFRLRFSIHFLLPSR